MKSPFLIALIFMGLTPFSNGTVWKERSPKDPQRRLPCREVLKVTRPLPVAEVVNTSYRTAFVEDLPAVAARESRENLAKSETRISGVALRVLTAPNPIEMISPFAPREYGSARGLVTYVDRDPYRTTNENKLKFQPNGIRVLTFRSLW